MSIRNLIYALVDPTTLEIRYIGLSSRGMSRPREHLLPGHYLSEERFNFPVYKWIRKLVAAETLPEIRILQYCGAVEELPTAEMKLIALWKEKGARLLNMTEGGDGTWGRQHTEESKEKMSIKRTGKKASDAHKAAISASLKGNKHSDEHRANNSAARKGKPLPEETKVKLSIARQSYWDSPEGQARKNKGLSAETLAKKSESMKEYWRNATEGEKNAMLPGSTGKHLSDEHKAKLSAAQQGKRYAAPVTKKCDLPGCENIVNLKTNKFCSIGCFYSHKRLVKDGLLPAPVKSAAASVIVRKKKV